MAISFYSCVCCDTACQKGFLLLMCKPFICLKGNTCIRNCPLRGFISYQKFLALRLCAYVQFTSMAIVAVDRYT